MVVVNDLLGFVDDISDKWRLKKSSAFIYRKLFEAIENACKGSPNIKDTDVTIVSFVESHNRRPSVREYLIAFGTHVKISELKKRCKVT